MRGRWVGRDAAIAGLCLAGAALSLLATYQTLAIQSGSLGTMLCGTGPWLDCRTAHASSFAVVLGVPVAWCAFLFFAWIGLATPAAAAMGIDRRAVALASAALASAGLLVCGVAAWVMVVHLRTFCPVCVALDLTTASLLVVLYGALDFRTGRGTADAPGAPTPAAPPARARADLPWCAASILLLAITGWGSMRVLDHALTHQDRLDEAAAVREHFRQSPVAVVVPAGAPTWGPAAAPVAVVMFSDFQCPFCKPAGLGPSRLLADYAGMARFQFVNFPLDSSVNPYVARSLHPLAGLAAAAGLCAQARGGFWAFHDDLLREQERLSQASILELARRRGWDPDGFLAQMRSPVIAARLRADVEAAHRAGVTGTPSVFVNGRPVRYWYHPRVLRQILLAEAAHAAGRRPLQPIP